MANTRNSQKKENDDAPAGAPVVADSKDSDNTDTPVITLDTILQELRSNSQELRSGNAQGEATQSELRSIRANFESKSEDHDAALLSFF